MKLLAGDISESIPALEVVRKVARPLWLASQLAERQLG